MKNPLDELSNEDRLVLLKAPALVSVLAALLDDGKVDSKEMADAIDMSHLRTFTADVPLQPFYEEAYIDFKQNLNGLIGHYSPFDDDQIERMKEEIDLVYRVMAKLDKGYAGRLKDSLMSYAAHVGNVHGKLKDFFDFTNFKVS
jgi:hypothetical protein